MAKRRIKFNGYRKPVEVTETDEATGQEKTQTLSRDEYKRYNEQISSGSPDLTKSGYTDKVKSLLETRKKNREIKSLIKEKGFDSSEVTSKLTYGQDLILPKDKKQYEEDMQKSKTFAEAMAPKINPEERTGLLQAPVSDKRNEEVDKLIDLATIKKENFIDEEGRYNPAEQRKQTANYFGEFGLSTLSLAFDMFDNVRAISSIGGRDTLDVKNAKQILSDTDDDIIKAIEAVSSGDTENYSELNQLLYEYSEAVSLLESESKRKGVDNLSYWLVGDRGLGGDIKEYQRKIGNYKILLEQAYFQGLQNKKQMQEINQYLEQ